MTQQIFSYSPKVEAYVASYRTGDMIDLTPDIIDATVNRCLDDPSTATITLSNSFKKYNRQIEPMDKIMIWMTRLQRTLVFTGYVDSAPFYSIYPGKVELTASDTLKRLQYTFWDPSLPSSINMVSKHIFNSDAPQGQKINIEGGLGYLIVDLLKDVGGWDLKDILVMPFPQEMIDRFTKTGLYDETIKN